MALANKKAWLWIAASVGAVVVLGGLVVLLYRGLSNSTEAAAALDKSYSQLVGFYERDPFPSRTNVVVEKANVAVIKQWREDLLKTLSAGSLEVPGKTPAQFEIFLSSRTKALREVAMRNGVKLPGSFPFGFARYADGKALPEAREDLPTRLTEQLVHIEHLCRLMFDAHISELLTVTRDEYPIEKTDPYGAPMSPGSGTGPAPRPTGPPSRLSRQGSPAGAAAQTSGPAKTSEYKKLHFAFELRASEPVLVDLLNKLASDPVFVVVNSVEVDTVADAQLGLQPRKEDLTNTVGRATARVVCGPDMSEPATVRIDLDVYRF